MSALVIGLDPHKASNTIAVLDAEETLVARRRFENTADGLVAMLEAVSGWSDRIWAVEGANGIGRSVAQRLVAAGEMVVDVPAKLATRVRVFDWSWHEDRRHRCGGDRPGGVAFPSAVDGPARR
jgi:hypothetical protein